MGLLIRRSLSLLALTLVALEASACAPDLAFTCKSDAQCVDGAGQRGSCEPSGFCSLPDGACPLGRRYTDAAGRDLASKCVPAATISARFRVVAATPSIQPSLEFDVPDLVPGDLILASIDVRGGANVQPPDDFTLVDSETSGGTLRKSTYYWFAGASEPKKYAWGFTSQQNASGILVAFANVEPQPIGAYKGRGDQLGTSITAPSVDASVAGGLLVGCFGIEYKTTISPPADMTELDAIKSVSSTSEMAAKPLGARGLTGDKTATATDPGYGVGQLVPLMPAAQP